MTCPVVIIGAGPAGIAAAIQLRRRRIPFLLLEKERIGGLLNEAQRVENFPGIAGGVPGRALAARLRRQLRAAGIQAEKSRVVRLSGRSGRFAVQTEQGTVLAASVILACGTLPLPPGPPLEHAPLRGLLFDSVLPLLKVRREVIAIIGGSDAAFDYALSLAGENRVHILVRSPVIRALPILQERCRGQRSISVRRNCRLAAVRVREGTGEIVLKTVNPLNGRTGEIACQRVLTAIGRAPALQFVDPALRGSLAGPDREKGIFLAGDVGNGPFRQAAIAAADGLRAAMEIREEGRCE